MNKLFDLRIVIGSFFCITGVLLFLHGLLSNRTGQEVNFWCGLAFILFGVAMLLLFRWPQKK